jgi:DNA modification methylase
MIFDAPGIKLIHGDCIQELPKLKSESIGFTVFSPPFPDLYCYSDDKRDMGNCQTYEEFEQHMSFLAPEIFRVMQQGRNIAIHCMDTPVQKGKYGYIGLRDFSGLIIRQFEQVGFIYHSRITIWKNPVTEMQRTKALGLLHKQVKKDATMSRVGIPDYVLVFRKDGERNQPVKCDINVDIWQKYASPVWMDIDYGDTLNAAAGREEEDEKHICPLQIPTIERLIHLYTNEGDTILTPFLGIGSEPLVALKMGRNAIGIELKKSYFDQAVKNVKVALEAKKQLLAF